MSLDAMNGGTSSDDSDSEKLGSGPGRPSVIVSHSEESKAMKSTTEDRPGHKTYSSDSGDLAMCSESGSEKESGASRGDSDSSASVNCYSLPSRKRKTPEKNKTSDSEPSQKIVARQCESYLQTDSCSRLSKNAKIFKCRECYKSPDTNQYSCRFFSFRKVRWSKANLMYADGFSSPFDAKEEDIDLWLPNFKHFPNLSVKKDPLDFHIARLILLKVGDQFCHLLHQEAEAKQLHMSDDDLIAWKKPMQGVREMCDVCKTTLFNFHWACNRCGFVVCIDCYKARKKGVKKAWMVKGVDHDEWKWLHCTTRHPHEQDTLMLCQTIAADCLEQLGQLVHSVRDMYKIPQTCKCEYSTKGGLLDFIDENHLRQLIKTDPVNAIIRHLEGEPKKENGSEEHEAHVVGEAVKQPLPDDDFIGLAGTNEDSSSDSDDDDDNALSGLRAFLVPGESGNSAAISQPIRGIGALVNMNTIRTYSRATPVTSGFTMERAQHSSPVPIHISKKPKVSSQSLFHDVISSVDGDSITEEKALPMQHFIRRNQNSAHVSHNQLPPRIMTKVQSEELYPGVPHSWLCDGRLLRLIDPSHSGNYRIFQDQWCRGQPVIVGNMTRLLNMNIWHPNSFCKDFGDDRNDLINCGTGNLVPNRPMREFWEGFENFSKRLKDEHGNPMLLKLKDWPPGEDFAELLPRRFQDLMQALPLAEYTRRSGRLNLASCLPDFFVRPDLGPKMYNAYGSALFPTKGTTNLHLDISDAVNFMVYVGIPTDADYEQHIKEAFNAIDEAGCDDMTRRRVRIKGEMPGALWHIYHACDADKIRDLLNKVAIERGTRLEPHHDPIHDQSWYLDAELRDRLYKEYDVNGYAIVQCLGDAVFIPAGAPHQVRNLHNCVKVAEDFVSPENVSHCFHLTQEFRDLSDTHSNHEDKLQIKNIIYHTIKNAVSSLIREVWKSDFCRGQSSTINGTIENAST